MQNTGKLTTREVEVLYLIAGGCSTKQIAHQLTISVRTTDKHRENILKKLNAPNLTAATTIAIQQQIIQPNKVNTQPLRLTKRSRLPKLRFL